MQARSAAGVRIRASILFDPPCGDCRLDLRSSRVHALVRGQRGAANMMLVQCNSEVPISLGCSIWNGNSPDHGIIGTASLGDLEGLRSGRLSTPD